MIFIFDRQSSEAIDDINQYIVCRSDYFCSLHPHCFYICVRKLFRTSPVLKSKLKLSNDFKRTQRVLTTTGGCRQPRQRSLENVHEDLTAAPPTSGSPGGVPLLESFLYASGRLWSGSCGCPLLNSIHDAPFPFQLFTDYRMPAYICGSLHVLYIPLVSFSNAPEPVFNYKDSL